LTATTLLPVAGPGVGVAVGVGVDVGVAVGVGVGDGVELGDGVPVGLGVEAREGVATGVAVTVTLGVGVEVSTGVGEDDDGIMITALLLSPLHPATTVESTSAIENAISSSVPFRVRSVVRGPECGHLRDALVLARLLIFASISHCRFSGQGT